jgi:rod shape determining protein RodA
MFVAGSPFRYLGSLAAVGVTMVALLLAALFLPARFGADEAKQQRIRGLTGLSDYQCGRIEVFFHPEKDPLGAGWNKRQSEIAVGSGGMWGKGYLHGTQNILGFLPRSVAPTDFIYSVIAEEKGFAGSLTVLVLFAFLLMLGMMAALRTRDAMGRLLCVGVASLFFCHVFINIAMTVGLMPITGLPLPLLSYGGSFMVIMMSALGIVQSVYIRSHRRDAFRALP